MSSANIPEQHVPVCRLVDGADGESRFVDAAIGYTTNLGPLRQTTVIPATAISFHWRPAGFVSEIHPTVRRRVILITEGAAEVTVGGGEARIFRPGDVLEALDCEGRGHVVRALGDLSFDFHNAPQRQIVLPLTGGIEGENGDGSRRQVPPGGVYFGEDTTGQDHITRALDSTVRFSIFAFLV